MFTRVHVSASRYSSTVPRKTISKLCTGACDIFYYVRSKQRRHHICEAFTSSAPKRTQPNRTEPNAFHNSRRKQHTEAPSTLRTETPSSFQRQFALRFEFVACPLSKQHTVLGPTLSPYAFSSLSFARTLRKYHLPLYRAQLWTDRKIDNTLCDRYALDYATHLCAPTPICTKLGTLLVCRHFSTFSQSLYHSFTAVAPLVPRLIQSGSRRRIGAQGPNNKRFASHYYSSTPESSLQPELYIPPYLALHAMLQISHLTSVRNAAFSSQTLMIFFAAFWYVHITKKETSPPRRFACSVAPWSYLISAFDTLRMIPTVLAQVKPCHCSEQRHCLLQLESVVSRRT